MKVFRTTRGEPDCLRLFFFRDNLKLHESQHCRKILQDYRDVETLCGRRVEWPDGETRQDQRGVRFSSSRSRRRIVSCVKGRFRMEFKDRPHEWIEEGEFIVVPRGVEHKPVAEEECWFLLFEPSGTLNTGNVVNERTHRELERVRKWSPWQVADATADRWDPVL